MIMYFGCIFFTKETRDPPMVHDNPIYAMPIKKPKVQAKNDMQPSRSKGKSPTGRAKKSRKF